MNALSPKVVASAPAALAARWQIALEVTSDLPPLEVEWRIFEQRAAGTFYQSFDWCRTWLETVGRDRKVEPRIVIGRNRNGAIAFLLPLAIRRLRGCRVIEWLTTGELGYGYGLYDRAFLPEAAAWFAGEGWRIVELAGPADALLLRDMPETLQGFAHPLLHWFSFRGRNSSFRLSIAEGFEAVHARKRSAESRRGQRKRDARLAKLGEVAFGLPATREETHRQLDEMFDQQRERLALSGVHGVYGPAERRFIHRLADVAGPALLPYRLMVGGKMAAMMLGGNYNGTYWALISSIAQGPASRYSPGDAALRRTIEACARRGMSEFDFSSGDTSYKSQWADETIDLFEAVRGLTARGYLWAFATGGAIYAKRLIKRSPILWQIARELRRRIAGTSAGG